MSVVNPTGPVVKACPMLHPNSRQFSEDIIVEAAAESVSSRSGTVEANAAGSTEATSNASAAVSIYGLPLKQLENYLRGHGKERFRAQQLYRWVFERRITDLDAMTNLSKEFRSQIASLLSFELPKVVQQLTSKDGTEKFLFDVGDGNTVEAVVIPSEDRWTLCVSSEVGCNMACSFCYTGKQKLKRRLRADEIVGQLLQVEDRLGHKVTNIVFMGMGEPLDNPEAVFAAIDVICEDFGRNFSRKKITVSTSGLVPQIPLVTASKTRLAVSLNGYNDESRSAIMPINKRYPLRDLLDACRVYCDETGDRVTFEYVLLKGVTDQLSHARELVRLVRGVPCKINIIPFNEHPGSGFERPSDDTVERFHQELMRLGAHVLLRRTMGRDIFAACGQLTSKFANKPERLEYTLPGEVSATAATDGKPTYFPSRLEGRNLRQTTGSVSPD